MLVCEYKKSDPYFLHQALNTLVPYRQVVAFKWYLHCQGYLYIKYICFAENLEY